MNPQIDIPDTIFGRKVDGAIERVLAKDRQKQEQMPEPKQIVPQSKARELQGHIYVPKIDLYVAKEKTLHNKDWYQSHAELHKQGLQMLTIPQFIEFVNYLKSNPKNQEYSKILDDILAVKDPWRTEWLDADFKVISGILHINYNHKTVNGQLKPQNSEPLEKCLMENCYADVFGSANRQGLPIKKSTSREVYYWFPRSDNNSVARFGADSDRFYLVCYWFPQFSYSALGVRAARWRP